MQDFFDFFYTHHLFFIYVSNSCFHRYIYIYIAMICLLSVHLVYTSVSTRPLPKPKKSGKEMKASFLPWERPYKNRVYFRWYTYIELVQLFTGLFQRLFECMQCSFEGLWWWISCVQVFLVYIGLFICVHTSFRGYLSACIALLKVYRISFVCVRLFLVYRGLFKCLYTSFGGCLSACRALLKVYRDIFRVCTAFFGVQRVFHMCIYM